MLLLLDINLIVRLRCICRKWSFWSQGNHHLIDHTCLLYLFVQVKAPLACTAFTSGNTKNTRSTRGSTTASPRPRSPSLSWSLGLPRSSDSRSNWADRRWGPRGEMGCGLFDGERCHTSVLNFIETRSLSDLLSVSVFPPSPCIPVWLVLPLP